MRSPRAWLLSEVAVAARAILALEREAAKGRQKRGGRGKKVCGNRRPLPATEATARRWGMGRDWLESLHKASDAAAADPERLGAILGWMDRAGSPEAAWAWVLDVRARGDEGMQPPPEGHRAPIVSDLATWILSDIDVAARALLDAMNPPLPEGADVVPLAPAQRSNSELRVVASLWGKGADWLRDILDVRAAAAADPNRFGSLVGLMDADKGKSAARAWSRMDRILDVERVKNVRPAEGKYRTLVMDVPWCEDNVSEGTDHAYAQMSFDQILGLKDQVLAWAAPDFCHLWFWYKNNTIALACQAVLHYGFTIRSNHTWAKPRWGQGRYARNNSEHVLFAVRGDKGCKPAYTRTPTVHPWPYPEGPESSKPDGFYQMVRDLSHEPYGEAFQRTPRPDFANLYVPIEAPIAAAAE